MEKVARDKKSAGTTKATKSKGKRAKSSESDVPEPEERKGRGKAKAKPSAKKVTRDENQNNLKVSM